MCSVNLRENESFALRFKQKQNPNEFQHFWLHLQSGFLFSGKKKINYIHLDIHFECSSTRMTFLTEYFTVDNKKCVHECDSESKIVPIFGNLFSE